MDCDCVARQAPLFMEFSGQEYWNGLPFPPPGDLSDPGIEPGSPAMQIDSLPSEPPGKAHNLQIAAMFTLLMLSPVHLFATLWTVAHQVPLSMRFFRQEYWNGYLLQYSCLQSSMDRGTWQITGHGVPKSQT